MTKRAAPPQDKKPHRDPKDNAATTTTTTTTKLEETFLPPLKPVPKLFAALLVGFAIWLGVLLTLYFQTVYPLRRHAPSTDAATATRPGASAFPSAPR